MKRKRIFSVFLALCMAVSMLPGMAAFAENAAPELTDGFYQLDSADDLFWFADAVNGGAKGANAVLTADVDLGEKAWTPIGAGYDYDNSAGGIIADTAYNGTFDGKNHTISGLSVTTKKYKKQGEKHYETYCMGLFGILGESATVKNLTIDGEINARAAGNEYIEAAQYVGSVAGINNGLVLNCTNNASVTGHVKVGGICGAVGSQLADKKYDGGKVINCVNNGAVVSTSESSAKAGGICGQLAWGEISYSANHGEVKAPYPENDSNGYASIRSLGGIAGSDINSADSSKIDRCYNDGKIGTDGGNYIAGIIGLNYFCDVTNVYNAGDVSGYIYSGGLTGYKLGGTLKNAYNSGSISGRGNTLIGKIDNAEASNLYSVGDSKNLYSIEKNSEDMTSGLYAVTTVSASELGDAFVDTETLPVIDFSDAPGGGDESFAVIDAVLENGKLTVYFDKALKGRNLTLDDFEIEAYANGEKTKLENAAINCDDGESTSAEITFDAVNAETALGVSVNGIKREIITPASDYWTDYRAKEFSGSGTKAAPFIISKPQELALLAFRVNKGDDMSGKYFALGCDIDLSGKKWSPIGYSNKYIQNKYSGCAFNGVFDGKNKAIRGIDEKENGYLSGLFGMAEDKAVIKNLSVFGRIENTNTKGYGVAAAVCAVNYGVVSNCKNFAEVIGAGRAGGICGISGAVNKTVTSSIITECENLGAVTAKKEAGGIVSYSSGTVTKCCNKAEVTALGGYSGGIAGYNYEGSVLLDSCYNTGKVTASGYGGGIAGKAYNSDISNSYNAGEVSAKKAGGILGYTVSGYLVKNCYYLSGTAPMPYAKNSGTGLEEKTKEQLSQMSEKLGEAFLQTDGLPILAWEKNGASDIGGKPSGGETETPEEPKKDSEKAPEFETSGSWTDFAASAFSGGDGSEENPYLISDGAQLAYLANRVNGGESFKDIHFALTSGMNIADKFFAPIGNSEETPFAGYFDGNGFEIVYNGKNAAVGGLFGFTDGAHISMLGVSGLAEGSELAGGIAASAKNTDIENCYSNVFVKSSGTAGGLVGKALSGSSVTNCYAGGKAAAEKSGTLFGVFANGVSVGNLFYRIAGEDSAIGENTSANTAIAVGKTAEYMQSDSFADDLWLIREKTVNGQTEVVAPLFKVGEKFPVLSGGYSESKIISVKINAPGKRLEQGASHRFTLSVLGKNLDNAGSPVWSADSDAVTISAVGTTADITVSAAASIGEKITVTAEWGGKTDSVEFVCGNTLWSGSGSAESPYIISTSEDFEALAKSVKDGNSYKGVHFALSGDLDMGGDSETVSVGYWDGLKSNDDGEWWESKDNRAFEGVFDGCGYSVKNAVLYAEKDNFGLFSYIGKSGEVKNLKIDSSSKLRAHNNVRSVGAVCGINLGRIENCENGADFSFEASNIYGIAGICGTNYGTVSGSKNVSDLTAAGASKAGIAAINYGKIENCENIGAISGAAYSGGISAENRNGSGSALLFVDKFADMQLCGSISGCKNSGSVSASSDAGGITADNYGGGLVADCENSADVSGSTAGGIAGRASGCYEIGGIKNCKNSGKISCSGSYGGGIVGELINGLVYFGENSGEVIGTKYAGGIAGRSYSTTEIGASAVDFSNNYGKVSAETAAGIVGYYQDESGKCYARYNFNGAQAEYAVLGSVNSRYDLNDRVAENFWAAEKSAAAAKDMDIGGAEALTAQQLEEYSPQEVTLEVVDSEIKVNKSTAVSSNMQVLSSDSNVVEVENGKATGKSVGKAYIYAKSSPYTYAAAVMNVGEDEDSAEKITVSFRLIGEKNLGSDFVLDKNTKNTYTTWIKEKNYTVKAGSTVGDVFKTALDESGFKYRGLEKGYISSVQSPDGYWLGEFSNGKYSGWMYTVNGSHPTVGLNDYKLTGGEEIIWHYVDDYRMEVADWSETSGEYAAIGDGSMHNRWLAADEEKSAGGKTPSGGSSGKNTGSTPSSSADSETQKSAQSFADVQKDAWYYDAVEYVCSNNLFKGISETEFAPNAELTRAMFVTVLYRFENEPNANGKAKFVDVRDESWYAAAVAWANENSIVSGISETEFAPDKSITREQMAAVMYNYAKFKGIDVSEYENTDISAFADCGEISDYAAPALRWMIGFGIMSGKSENTLNPKDTATRAETAMIIMKLIKGMA